MPDTAVTQQVEAPLGAYSQRYGTEAPPTLEGWYRFFDAAFPEHAGKLRLYREVGFDFCALSATTNQPAGECALLVCRQLSVLLGRLGLPPYMVNAFRINHLYPAYRNYLLAYPWQKEG